MKRLLAILLCLLMVIGAAGSVAEETKDTLVVCKANETITLSAFTLKNAPQNKDQIVTYSMYDTMLLRDSLNGGEILPNLATEWTMSDDGLLYTFKLRDDVTFWNGSKLTAADVVWTIEQGLQNATMYSVYFSKVDKAVAADDYTVEIYMKTPCPYFLNVFAGQGGMIMSKDYFEQVGSFEAYNENPMGSGPYKYVSHETGVSLTLAANENYWGGVPAIKNVVFKYISDTNAQIIALETGEVDLLIDAPVNNLKFLDTSKGVNWSSDVSYQVCNATFRDIPGSQMLDENLRKAILSAIDYESVNYAVLGGLGQHLEINNPQGFTGRPEDGTYTPHLPYDVEAAKKYLAESNYVAGTPVVFACIAGGIEEAAGKIIQGYLQEVGINMQLSATDQATFFAAMASKQADISVYSGVAATFDIDGLFTYFDQSRKTDDMKSVYPDAARIQELGEIGASTADPEVRKEVYTEMVNLINDHAYQMIIFQNICTLAYNSNLKGATPKPQGNYRLSDFSW